MTAPHFIRVGDIDIWYIVRLKKSEDQFRVYVTSRYEAADRSVINLKETAFCWNFPEDIYNSFEEIIYVRHGTRDGLAHDFGKELLVDTFNVIRKLNEAEIIGQHCKYLRESIYTMITHDQAKLDILKWRLGRVDNDSELDELFRDTLQRGSE